jgi:hypothetical protein
MVTFDEHNPPCPICSVPCSSNYHCKFCNCNMHWFCSIDKADGSILGHGAHYCCIQCNSNSKGNDGNESEAPRIGKRKGSTALNAKPSSNSNSRAKASSTGKRKASTALNEKPTSYSNSQARASGTGKSKGSTACDTMMNSSSNSQAIDGRRKRASNAGKKKGSTALTGNGQVHMKTRGSVKKKASMKSRNVQKKSGAGQVPQTSRTGDVATDAFSRAIANSKDVASPIAQSLFDISLVHSPPPIVLLRQMLFIGKFLHLLLPIVTLCQMLPKGQLLHLIM